MRSTIAPWIGVIGKHHARILPVGFRDRQEPPP